MRLCFKVVLHIVNRLIGIVGREFANGPGDMGSAI